LNGKSSSCPISTKTSRTPRRIQGNAEIATRGQRFLAQLDPTDNNDPTLRINTLTTLSDPETVLHGIREAMLVKSPALGRFTLRDILITSGKFSAPASSDEKPAEEFVMLDFSVVIDEIGSKPAFTAEWLQPESN